MMLDNHKVKLDFEKWLVSYKEFIQHDKDVVKHLDNNKYWIELGFQAAIEQADLANFKGNDNG